MTVKVFRRPGSVLEGVASAVEMQLLNFALLPAQALPLSAALQLGRAVGRGAAAALPKYRHRAEEQLRTAFPEKPETWVQKTAVACFEHFGQLAVEMIKMPRFAKSRRWAQVVSVPSEKPMLELLRQRKGAIWLTGHLGNWELAAQWAGRHDLELTSIAHQSRNPRIHERMQREREARGHTTVRMEGAFRELIRALRRGAMVALLTDRNPRDTGMIVPFFGRDILTVTTPALLSCATGAPIVPFACLRNGWAFRYTLHFGDPIWPDPAAPREAEVARITRASAAALEAHIRMAPEQWQWMHRRWKITPGGRVRAGLAPAEGAVPATAGR
ncbi:MAG: lysophospholipid acyltransferase family protein [Planctomycetia bacterium]|nr:lysophospholipid acyltransferase family protein [Planctomycetia bacterium]